MEKIEYGMDTEDVEREHVDHCHKKYQLLPFTCESKPTCNWLKNKIVIYIFWKKCRGGGNQEDPEIDLTCCK